MHGVLLLPKVLLYAVLLWSLVTIATPSIARMRIGATDAAGVMGIMLWRLLLGLLEGVTYPTMYVTVMRSKRSCSQSITLCKHSLLGNVFFDERNSEYSHTVHCNFFLQRIYRYAAFGSTIPSDERSRTIAVVNMGNGTRLIASRISSILFYSINSSSFFAF